MLSLRRVFLVVLILAVPVIFIAATAGTSSAQEDPSETTTTTEAPVTTTTLSELPDEPPAEDPPPSTTALDCGNAGNALGRYIRGLPVDPDELAAAYPILGLLGAASPSDQTQNCVVFFGFGQMFGVVTALDVHSDDRQAALLAVQATQHAELLDAIAAGGESTTAPNGDVQTLTDLVAVAGRFVVFVAGAHLVHLVVT